MARAVSKTRKDRLTTDRRLDGRAADLLPDPLHDHHQLQDRTGGDAGFNLIPSWTLESYAEVSRRTTISSLHELGHDLGRLDPAGADRRHPGGLGDGLRRRPSGPRTS
jgi:hypothetical protein